MEQKKKLKVLQAFSLRDLVDGTNNIGLQKDDIVTILPNEENGFYLLYFN